MEGEELLEEEEKEIVATLVSLSISMKLKESKNSYYNAYNWRRKNTIVQYSGKPRPHSPTPITFEETPRIEKEELGDVMDQ